MLEIDTRIHNIMDALMQNHGWYNRYKYASFISVMKIYEPLDSNKKLKLTISNSHSSDNILISMEVPIEPYIGGYYNLGYEIGESERIAKELDHMAGTFVHKVFENTPNDATTWCVDGIECDLQGAHYWDIPNIIKPPASAHYCCDCKHYDFELYNPPYCVIQTERDLVTGRSSMVDCYKKRGGKPTCPDYEGKENV